jgi:hypothetical protein
MNDHTSQGRRRGLPRRTAIGTAAAGLILLTAACGSPAPGRSAQAYSACMHSHGVTGALASPLGDAPLPSVMPTPGSTRQIPAKAAAAIKACQSLAPLPTGRPGAS